MTGATVREGIAIPGQLLRFLERASIAYACTRDRGLAPHVQWLCGWKVEDDASLLSVFLAKPFDARLLADVAESPRLAVTVEWIGPHETYQFKGDFCAQRPPAAADFAAYERCLERAIRDIQALETRFDFTAEALSRYMGRPALVATLRVQEIFLQTPGPGAGRRLAPPPDAL